MHCELCKRENQELTFHHLVPKKTHKKSYVQKLHSDKDLNTFGIDICKPCHKAIHIMIDHKELAMNHYTLDLLFSHQKLAEAIKFNAKQGKFKRPKR